MTGHGLTSCQTSSRSVPVNMTEDNYVLLMMRIIALIGEFDNKAYLANTEQVEESIVRIALYPKKGS